MERRGEREGGVAATGTTNTVEHLKMDTLIDTKVVQCSVFEG